MQGLTGQLLPGERAIERIELKGSDFVSNSL